MKTVSQRAAALPRSGIRLIHDLAKGPDVLHLEIGQPDFSTPTHIVEAAHAAARAGMTRYTPNAGLASLREAIAEKVERENLIPAAPDRIVVTMGAMQGLYASLLAILEPGDEVLVPDPGYPNYGMAISLCGARPIPYPLRPQAGFQPDTEAIPALIGDRTKAIMINSPSNPTGNVISRECMARMAEIAERFDLYVISDECYEKILFAGSHVSPASMGDPERFFTVNSFSKTYAMTGWRVGYVVAPPRLAPTVVKLQEPVVACACSVSQAAPSPRVLKFAGLEVFLCRFTRQPRRWLIASNVDTRSGLTLRSSPSGTAGARSASQ